MKQQPATAPAAATSQVAKRCFHLVQDATGENRQNAITTTIAAMKPARERMIMAMASGVPKTVAAASAITAAGMTAFLIPE